MNNFYPNIISLSFLISRYLYKFIKIQYSNLFKIAHSFYFPKIFKKTTIFYHSLTINPLPFVMINISIHSFATNSKLLHVVINRDIISKNFWFYKKITRNQFKKKKKIRRWIVRNSIQMGYTLPIHLFVYCTQWTIDGVVSFENFSPLPPIVSPGYFVGICKEEVERLSLLPPPPCPSIFRSRTLQTRFRPGAETGKIFSRLVKRRKDGRYTYCKLS